MPEKWLLLLSRQNNLILSLAFSCLAPVSPFVSPDPETNAYFVLSSFFDPAAIQVQITPTQGEISVGDSKFFLCEGKGDLQRASFNTA